MITASAISLSETLLPDEVATGLLYPRLTRIREVSAQVACGVIRQAQKQGLDTVEELREISDEELLDVIRSRQWSPYETEEDALQKAAL